MPKFFIKISKTIRLNHEFEVVSEESEKAYDAALELAQALPNHKWRETDVELDIEDVEEISTALGEKKE